MIPALPSHAARVCEHEVAGRPGLVLVDRHQARHPSAFLELCANQVPGPLGGNHADVDAGRRLDLAEVDREAVGEHQQVALAHPVADIRFPDLCLAFVGQQDHHHVAAAGGVCDVEHLEAGGFRLRAGRRVGTQPDHDVVTGLRQVQRVRVALGAEAQDRDRLALQGLGVCVGVVEDS